MTPEEISEYSKRLVQQAEEELGDDACEHDIALHTIGVSLEDMNAIAHYVDECVKAHIYNRTVAEGPMNPSELTENIIGVCVPTIMLIGKMMFKDKQTSIDDQYLTTVHAEMAINTMIEDEKDMSEIWPAQFVEEIAASLPNPQQAFLAGVMCGRSHG